MPSVEFIDKAVLVDARLLDDGQAQPKAFRWRGQGWHITEIGRQWPENDEGVAWECYLVRTSDGSAFELRLNPETASWRLARAWLVDHLV